MALQNTWTLLDATSTTGCSILRSLLRAHPPGIRLNIQIPSRSRLFVTLPRLELEALAVGLSIHIIEGDITDPLVLDECLEDVHLAILCIDRNGTRRSMKRYSITAGAIGRSIERIRYRQYKLGNDAYQPPTVIQLRAASLKPTLTSRSTNILCRILRYCLHRRCNDLQETAAAGDNEKRYPSLHYISADSDTISHPEQIKIGQLMDVACGEASAAMLTSHAGENEDFLEARHAGGAKERLRITIRRFRLCFLGGLCYMGLAMGSVPGSVACCALIS